MRKVGCAPARRFRWDTRELTSAFVLSAGMVVRVAEGGRRIVVKVVSVSADEPRVVVERGDGARCAVTLAEIVEIVRA